MLIDMEWCADPLDMATKIAENENLQRIQEQLDRAKCSEQPDEDENGTRYCLDCAEVIDPRRVAAVNAVRCVVCATAREARDDSRLRRHGGINRIIEDLAGPREVFNAGTEL